MRIAITGEGQRGFTLIEAIVGIALLASVLASLSGLFVLTANANRRARHTTLAVTFAASKLESLRQRTASASPSPGDSLWQNRDGFCERLDSNGDAAGTCGSPPGDGVFVRRWSVAPGPVAATMAVRVAVGWQTAALSSTPAGLHDEIRLSTVLTVHGS